MKDKELANNYLNDTLSLKRLTEKNFLELGQRLMKIRDEQLFLATHSSFVEFLWDMKMTESTASKIINIYSHFILHLGIDQEHLLDAGGWTTVYQLKDLAKDKDTAEEWLHKAAVLSPKDFKTTLEEARSGKKQEDCEKHEFVTFRWCKHCHLKEKVYEDE